MAERRRDPAAVKDLEAIHTFIKPSSFQIIIEYAAGFSYGVGIDRICDEIRRLRAESEKMLAKRQK